MPPKSLEETIGELQTTARKRGKTNLRLHEAVRAINALLVRSCSDEITVDVPGKDAIRATRRRQDGPVDGFGVHCFAYLAQDKGVLRELALALRYTRREKDTQTGNDVQSFNWVPLVRLQGSGAPPMASRRLKVWVGENLSYLVALLSDAMAKRVQDRVAAANDSRTAIPLA